jgi:predicted phage terminase large subunit-like protein
MQRLSEKDTSGIILGEKLGYTHLCLPMYYEPENKCKTSIGFEDPRKKAGELLFPERFSAATVKSYERTLGQSAFAGQMQQRPSPAGGGILKTKYFQRWSCTEKPPALDLVVQSYDTAFTKDTMNDPTACSVWGIFNYKKKRCAILLDVWAEHLEYPELREKVLDEWHSTYGATDGRKGRKADFILIEKKASGQSLLQDLRIGNVPVKPYEPAGSDKIARAHQVAPFLELECLYIPESKKEPGTYVSWARPFVDQCEKFPNAAHDDMVDTMSQFIIFARDSRMLELEIAEDDVVEDEDYTIKRRAANPYSV